MTEECFCKSNWPGWKCAICRGDVCANCSMSHCCICYKYVDPKNIYNCYHCSQKGCHDCHKDCSTCDGRKCSWPYNLKCKKCGLTNAAYKSLSYGDSYQYDDDDYDEGFIGYDKLNKNEKGVCVHIGINELSHGNYCRDCEKYERFDTWNLKFK